jgi:hypothetical protein
MNKIATSTKNFVAKHKTALAVVATATVTLTAAVALTVRNASITNEFLKKHDLYDEFYAMDEE